MDVDNGTYKRLFELVKDKDYFVLTTNVDHQFQKAGFDKHRLFYTQGDYGLWQCSEPCHQKTYDNEETVRAMFEAQKNMRVPSELVPHCPVCGKPMSMNLRADDTFVEDEGWHRAAERYDIFSAKSRRNAYPVLRAWCGHEHACHHKVSVLEDDLCKPEGDLCLPEFRGSVCTR